jgi:hypothetical protein
MTPPKPICKTCNDSEWVCEFHPDKPWGDALTVVELVSRVLSVIR